jgi:hypothetical protein
MPRATVETGRNKTMQIEGAEMAIRIPRRRRSVAATLAATALLGMVSFGAAQQASAETVTTYVDNNGYASNAAGIFTLTYNSNGAGAAAWFMGNVPTYDGSAAYEGSDLHQTVYVFQQNGGSGHGVAVKNNAAWGANTNVEDSYTIYYNSSYEGASQLYYPVDYGFSQGNLDATLKNNEASQYERVYV